MRPDEGITRMKFRIARAVLAITMIVLVMVSPLLSSVPGWQIYRRLGVLDVPFELHTPVLAQDDNDNDDEDNDDDDDDNDEDNDDDDDDNDEDNDDDDDNDEDNDDEDNDDSDNDEDDDDDDDDDGDFDNEVFDDGSSGASSPLYTFDFTVTEATGISTGGDSRIGLPGDRIVVQVFPWMPPGVSLSITMLDPLSLTPPTGTIVEGLVFQIAARDSAGFELAQLPAEVNLSARYTDQAVVGLNEFGLTLLWLDPFDQQWKPAPKIVTDSPTNYVGASVMNVGTYAVVIQ